MRQGRNLSPVPNPPWQVCTAAVLLFLQMKQIDCTSNVCNAVWRVKQTLVLITRPSSGLIKLSPNKPILTQPLTDSLNLSLTHPTSHRLTQPLTDSLNLSQTHQTSESPNLSQTHPTSFRVTQPFTDSPKISQTHSSSHRLTQAITLTQPLTN